VSNIKGQSLYLDTSSIQREGGRTIVYVRIAPVVNNRADLEHGKDYIFVTDCQGHYNQIEPNRNYLSEPLLQIQPDTIAIAVQNFICKS
jgi:hypothetical protein